MKATCQTGRRAYQETKDSHTELCSIEVAKKIIQFSTVQETASGIDFARLQKEATNTGPFLATILRSSHSTPSMRLLRSQLELHG